MGCYWKIYLLGALSWYDQLKKAAWGLGTRPSQENDGIATIGPELISKTQINKKPGSAHTCKPSTKGTETESLGLDGERMAWLVRPSWRKKVDTS